MNCKHLSDPFGVESGTLLRRLERVEENTIHQISPILIIEVVLSQANPSAEFGLDQAWIDQHIVVPGCELMPCQIRG